MKQHEEISLDSAIRLQAQIHEHCLARGDSDLDWMLDFDGDGAWIDLRIDPFTR